MLVGSLIATAFEIARSRQEALVSRWIAASVRVGGLLPRSTLMVSVQRVGELDVVLRCMEEEITNGNSASISAPNYLMDFAELWIGSIYEIVRVINSDGIGPDNDELKALGHELRLLRVPLEKFQLAQDDKLKGASLALVRRPPNGDDTDEYVYSRDDKRRSHVLPRAISGRGSAMWGVIDIKNRREFWLERRDISDRFLKMWSPLATVA